MFLTRIPCPNETSHGADALAKSVGWWPIVGWLLGSTGGAAVVAARLVMPPEAAAVVGVAIMALLTGCLHEDAFADLCDGFGGFTPERRLEIMRDSRVGSYGVMGLVLITALRIELIASMHPLSLIFSLGRSAPSENREGTNRPGFACRTLQQMDLVARRALEHRRTVAANGAWPGAIPRVSRQRRAHRHAGRVVFQRIHRWRYRRLRRCDHSVHRGRLPGTTKSHHSDDPHRGTNIHSPLDTAITASLQHTNHLRCHKW